MRSTIAIFGSLVLFAGTAMSQVPAPAVLAAVQNPSVAQVEQPAIRAFPRVDFGGGRQLEYVGALTADGKFKRVSRFGRFVDAMITASVPEDEVARLAARDDGVRWRIAPTFVRFRPREVVDIEPPARAVVVAGRPGSVVGELRDAIVNFTVGPDPILSSPLNVTTDSRQRVIISDPAMHAVDVIGDQQTDSFRIVGGEGSRLQSPSGVAVDDEDNIYVADAERGMVLVYDSEGRFLRYIGNIHGENFYERPTAIAIDRAGHRLYLADTARHMVFILDLEGNILARIGIRGGGTKPGQLRNPTGVAVRGDELVVVDANGSRVQIFDLQGNLRQEFPAPTGGFGKATASVCFDSEGKIYVTNLAAGTVRVFRHDGRLLRVFGRPGTRMGEFNAPTGIWADASDRLYVVDSSNVRLQVFQLSGPK